ncbi:MAG: hypothetical protein WC838_06375, partial [Candidatus Margulisiibacteriota bacterium]
MPNRKTSCQTAFLIMFFLLSLSLSYAKVLTPGPVNEKNLASADLWDLTIGGLAEAKRPGLLKAPKDQGKWNAILRLKKSLNIARYLGKTMYFFTEIQGDKTVRCAPNFFVVKNKKTYSIWWQDAPNKGSIARRYYTFKTSDGVISGELGLPGAVSGSVFYALAESGDPAFLIGDDTEVNFSDLQKGLLTDWQHDTPGAYEVSSTEKFPGASGRVVLPKIYIGAKKPVALLKGERDEWCKLLSEKELGILNQEFAVPTRFATAVLADDQYYTSSEQVALAKQYCQNNRLSFVADPYFQKKNYFPWFTVLRDWQVVQKEPGTKCYQQEGALVIENKKDAKAWTIIKLGEVDQKDIPTLAGVVRFRADLDISGLEKGAFDWQTVILDIVQLDKQGQDIGHNDELSVPLCNWANVNNYYGVFENEFVINKDVKKIALQLKIAGSRADHPDKAG